MNTKAFWSSIRAAYSHYSALRLLEQAQSFEPLRPSDAFLAVSRNRASRYDEVFRVGLREHDYNFLLVDYSFLQFGFVERAETSELRLAFYPNPFETIGFDEFLRDNPEAALSEEPFEDYLEALGHMPARHAITPVRYDLSTDSYRELVHPSAHFHLGFHTHSRWPVDKIVTPEVFSLLIAKLFYPDAWEKGGLDEAYCQRKVACVALGEDAFSEDERRQLFLT